jgi:hypothetical protein
MTPDTLCNLLIAAQDDLKTIRSPFASPFTR